MSFTQEGSSAATSKAKKLDAKRRSWNQVEETFLIVAMKDLVRSGKYKADNGFKAGYLLKLESDLHSHCPGTDLMAHPHITSKLSTWKKNYHSLRAVLSRSGVGFSSRGNFMLECEDDQWTQIIKVDLNARQLRNKPWPYYADWQEIFGTDRANGEKAEDVEEAFMNLSSNGGLASEFVEDVGKEFGEENELSQENTDNLSQSIKADFPTQKTKRSKKKARMSEELHGVCEILANMNEATNARLDHLASRIGWEYDHSKARQETNEQLKAIPGLSTADRFIICEVIAMNDTRLDIWRGLKSHEDKTEYIEHLMRISRA